mgnify:FL=1|jgi:hypothetical protein
MTGFKRATNFMFYIQRIINFSRKNFSALSNRAVRCNVRGLQKGKG